MKVIDARDKYVLIIPDLHCPHHHVDAFKFLKRIKEQLPEDAIIINLGDEIDGHAWSFHTSDSDLDSAGVELSKAIIYLQEGLHTLFPKMHILESNHGSLLSRKLKHHGIPIRALKPMQELYETPLWQWHNEILLRTNIGNVYLTHGKSGAYGKLCKEMGMSCIQGHYHTKFEITWHESATQKKFNMIAGCLADRDHMAMAYAKNLSVRFQLGAAYLDNNGWPSLIPMPLDETGRLR